MKHTFAVIGLCTAMLLPGFALALTVEQKTPEHGEESANTKVLWESVESQEATAAVSPPALSETTFGKLSAGTTWIFLLTGIVASAFAGVIIVRSGRRDGASPVPADEYAIIEDIIESVDD